MVEKNLKEKLKNDQISIGPAVFSGLWGNLDFHKYRLLSDLWKPFGINGKVYGRGKEIQSWNAFEKAIQEDLISAVNSGQDILIGNSIGGTFLLKAIYEKEVPFNKLFLFGFDPNPSIRNNAISDKQKDVWEKFNIPKTVINSMFGIGKFDQKLANEISIAIEWGKSQKNIFFVHGTADETIPITEMRALDLINLVEVEGMEHNSSKKIERILGFIMKKGIGVDFYPLLNNIDLLNIPNTLSNGILPFFSGERIGFGPVYNGSRKLPFQNFNKNGLFLGNIEEVPEGYLQIASFDKKAYAVNILQLVDSGYVFYSPIVPSQSLYSASPKDHWVNDAYEIRKKINKQANVTTGKDKILIQEFDLFKEEVLIKFENSIMKDALSFFDEDNNLFKHIFEVYKSLILFGIDPFKALPIAVIHDIGKGIYIKYSQFLIAKQLAKKNMKDITGNDIRAMGQYRSLVDNILSLSNLLTNDENLFNRTFETFSLIDKDLSHDRSISLKIFDRLIKQREINLNETDIKALSEYLSGDFSTENAQLIRLADFVSPFIYTFDQKEISIESIKRIICFRLKGINNRYKSNKTVNDYLTEELIERFNKL